MERECIVICGICAVTTLVAAGVICCELARLRKTMKRMENKMAATLSDLDAAIADSSASANDLGQLATDLQDVISKLVTKLNSPTDVDYSAEVSKLTGLGTVLKSVSDAMNAAKASGTLPTPSNPDGPGDSPITPSAPPNATQPVQQTVNTEEPTPTTEEEDAAKDAELNS